MYNNKKYNKKHDNGDHRTRGEKAVDKFVEMIIARMEEMKAGDWKKGWISGSGMNGMPQNISGRTYNGSNSFFLQLATANKNYKTPVFMTFLQVQKEGAHVLKGEESMPVVYWNFTIKDKETGKKIDRNEYNRLSDEEKAKYEIKPFLTAYLVYNIDQTNLKDVNKEKYDKLVEKFKPKAVKDTNGMYENAALDRLFQHQEWVCPIQVDKRSPSAYYSPSRDQIVVPMKEQFKISNTPEEIFKDGMEYYSSAIHEMAHSTGTPERLNRTKGDKFGDEKYAKEELVAELTAASVGYSMGFDPRIIDNNAAYLDGWIDTLKENHNFIVSVMADVNKAADMIIEAVDKQLIALGEKPIKGKSIEDEQEEDNKQEQPEQVAKATYNVQAINSQELSMVSEPLYQKAPSNDYTQTDDLSEQKASQTTDQSGAVTQQQTSQQADVQPVAVEQQQSTDLTVSLQQQIADFKEATGIQLEIQGNKLVHNGDLDLADTNIEKLPDNLTVNGSLDLSNTPIKELPKNLTVNNSLWLDKTKIEKLPEDLTVEFTLSLSNTPIKELPENIKINRNLWLDDSNIQRLPDNFTVNGFLDLSNTPIKELPDNLTVKGDLDLTNTSVTELPTDLKVKDAIYMNDRTIEANSDILTKDGYIDLAKAGAPIAQKQSETQQASQQSTPDRVQSADVSQQQQQSPQTADVSSVVMTSQQDQTNQQMQQQIADFKEATGKQLEIQGNKLVHNGDLDLSKTNIERLPDNLTVKGTLNISNTPIKELPKNLTVDDSLLLENSNVERLPEDLTVESTLSLYNTPVKELPDNLTVGGSLDLDRTAIKELPEKLSVNGSLWLANSNIEKLPDNLTVNGDLDLSNTPIKEMPKNLTVDDSLLLENSNVEKLPDNLTVNGALNLANAPIKELPDNIKVNGDLWLQNTNIERLPDNLTVEGNLWLENTPIKELPDNLTIKGWLDLSNTPIKDLPDNLTIKGWLDLSNTPIKDLPADLKVKEAIYMSDRTIKANSDILTKDGYIDLAKAGAPIAQKFEQNEQMSNNVSPRTMEYGKNTIDAISNRAAEIIKKTFDENDIEKTVLNNERITKAANNMILKEIEKNPHIIAAPQEQKTKDDGIPDNIKDANFIGMVQVGQKGPKLYFTDEEKFNAYVEKAWESGHYLNKSIIRNNNVSDSIKKDIDQNLSQQKDQNAEQTIVPSGAVTQQQNEQIAQQPQAEQQTTNANQKADELQDQKTNLENKLFNIIKDAKGLDLKDSYGVYFILNEPVKTINDNQAPESYKLQEDSKILGMFMDRNRKAQSDILLYQDKEGKQQFVPFNSINKGVLETLIEGFSRQKEADQLIPIMAKYIRENNTFALTLPSNNYLHITDVNNVSDSDKLDSLAIQMDHKYRQAIDFQKDNGILLEKMMEASKVHALALPDGVKIEYDNGMLTVDKYKENVIHAEFASLPKNEQDSLGWSATEKLLDTLQNTLKKYAEQTSTDLTVNLPNGDTVHLNKGNLDDTYSQLSKLEKIGVLNSFASAAEADAQILFDNALKNSKDNKIFLEPNNWIQKENDGSLSIVLVKDNETNKASLNDFNGLTQWSIVSYAIEQLNQTIIQQTDLQSVTEKQQQRQNNDELTPTQKLEAIGYPYSKKINEDGSFNIPTVNESLYWRYAAGIITLNEAAREFTKHGWTNFVDEDYTRKQFAEINQKYHKLSDDLQPLSPEQIALQKAEQQIAEFKEATGIQLEVRDGKPFYEGYLNLKDSNVQQLPENLTVNGALNLANAPIKELPENLTVKGDLYLEYTKIERLPDNLSVGGSLDLSYTPIKELPDNLTISGTLWLLESEIQQLPENLTVNDSLDVEGTLITELTDLPANLKVKGNIYMNSQTITATPEVMTTDGYIDLVKAGAPIAQKAEQQANQTTVTPVDVPQQQNEQTAQQPQAEQQTTNANQKADTTSMEESPTAKEYAIMWMTSIAEKTPKDRPSDIVFVKDFSLEDPTKPIYMAYGKDADRLAEKVSSSVAAMRPEIEGQRYPNATVNSGNIEAVRADLMINNVRPVIIDLEGNRITNDKTLDYTKEERKAFLDSLKPEAKQRQDIAETIQRLGNPDRIVVPQLYNSHSVYAGPELIVPHRFGYQEVPVLQLVKSKNGSYRAGNDDDGYYPIEKMDTNNLYEVQKALKIVENNRPQKLFEELEKQIDSGRASVEKDIANNHYKFTIYDQQNDLHYPRGNKSFTINTEVKDKIYLHPDDKNYVTEHKVDPQLIKKLTTYAESKLNTPKKDIEATVKYSQDNWLLSAKVNGVNLQPRIISQKDAGDFKKGLISKEDLVQKTFGDLSQQQEEKRTRSMKL